MPYVFRIRPELNLVVTAAWGELSSEDIVHHRESLSAHADFRLDMDQLVDYRRVRSPFSYAEIRKLVASDPFRTGSRRALVTNSDLEFGLARAYGTLSESGGGEFRPCRTLEEACAWLGVPASVMDGLLPPEE